MIWKLMLSDVIGKPIVGSVQAHIQYRAAQAKFQPERNEAKEKQAKKNQQKDLQENIWSLSLRQNEPSW